MASATLSRRALFAAAPAAALAAAVPVAAQAANPDTALLALGESLNLLIRESRAARRLEWRLFDQCEARSPKGFQLTEQGREQRKQLEQATGFTAAYEESNQLGASIEALAKQIDDIIATTPAGLKVKAKLALYHTTDWDDDVWGASSVKALIEDVLALEVA